MGVTTDGVKVPLGLWDGSTENKRVCVELLADLVDRGLDCDQGVLVVLDGGKALRAAVDAVFGHVPVQRCIRHKERNVLDHLPERDRPAVKRRLRAAWKLTDHRAAIERLEALAGELAHSHPGAAASLREGLAETVTLQRLGVHQQLWKTLSSTNPIESMIGICRATSRNVKRWQNGDMCLRWTAAGMLEAERQFRKIIGYKHLAALALAVEARRRRRDAPRRTDRPPHPPTRPPRPNRPLRSQPLTDHRIATAKFHGERDNLLRRCLGAGNAPSGPSTNVAPETPGADHRHAASSDLDVPEGTPSILRPCLAAPASRRFRHNVPGRPTRRVWRNAAGQ